MTIVIKKSSGGVAVMRVINDGDAATCLEQWKQANQGEYVTHADVAEESLPQDRSQRDLWSLVDGAVVIDQSLAPVPHSVTRRQARQALLLSGKLSLVQPAIDAIADPTDRAMIQIEWDDSQQFIRNRPALIALGTAIGLSSAEIDALFVQASKL